MLKSRLPAIAVFFVGLAAATGLPIRSASAALVLPLLAVIVGPRFKAGAVGQALFTIFAAFFGLMMPTIIGEPARLHDLQVLSERRTLFFFTVHAIAVARCVLYAPRMGIGVTMLASLVALAAAGGALSGLVYPISGALFFIFAIASFNAANAGRTERLLKQKKRAAVALGVIGLAGTLAVLSGTYLPALQEAAISRYYKELGQSRIGFSDKLDLGSMANVLLEDEVVLRVRGRNQPELLRGAVFTRYLGRRWDPPNDLNLPIVLETQGKKPPGQWLELEHAEPPPRYFLPADTSRMVTQHGYLLRDELGVASPPENEFSKRLWFQRGSARRILPPRAEDRVVPPRLETALLSLVQRWGADQGPLEQRIKLIDHHLRHDYEYALIDRDNEGRDPVEEFLFGSKRGHCEFFASSAALLGRVAGVPTRVITGYRVAERSRFDYSVVRKRHAHAWIEAHTEKGWTTVDPTPPDPLMASAPRDTPLFAALRDLMSTLWERADDRLEDATPLEFGVILVLLVGVWILIRALRSTEKKQAPGFTDEPLLGYSALASKLSRRGIKRSSAETLSHFAIRLQDEPDIPEDEKGALRAVLQDYAALRYGGEGSSAEIEDRLRSLAERL